MGKLHAKSCFDDHSGRSKDELNHSAVANLELAIFAHHASRLFPGLDNLMFRSHNLLIGRGLCVKLKGLDHCVLPTSSDAFMDDKN
jgi:hypothetical protein